MARYAVWNKTDDIITPSGAVFTPSEWIAKYPVAATHPIICGGGVVNGGFFAIYEQFVEMYAQQGCDFEGCETERDYLDRIEEWEDNRPVPEEVPAAEERIAAALEAQVMMSMMDIEE